MLTGRQKNDFKIILALLALSITLLAVPILAKQQRNKSTNNRSAKGQQAKNTSTTINARRPLNTAKTPTRITPIRRSSKSSSASSILRSKTAEAGLSRNKGLSSLGKVTKSNISQPGRIVPSRQTNGAALGKRSILQLQSSIRVRTPSNTKMPAGISSSIAKPSTISPDNNRNSNRTSSNSRKVITNPSVSFKARIPSIAGLSTQPRTGIPKSTTTIIDSRTHPAEPLSRSRISSNKTLDIAGLIGKQEPPSLRASKSQLSEQTRDTKSDFRTRLDEVLSRNRTRLDNSSRWSIGPESEALSRSRKDSLIMKQDSSPSIMDHRPSVESRAAESQTRHRSNSRLLRALEAIGKKTAGNKVAAERMHKNINLRVVDNLRAGSAERQKRYKAAI
jgi:hypothetical protein